MIKNITLSAENSLIEKARIKAKTERRSLNIVFREWLQRYTSIGMDEDQYVALMKRFRYVSPGQKFSREEMNER